MVAKAYACGMWRLELWQNFKGFSEESTYSILEVEESDNVKREAAVFSENFYQIRDVRFFKEGNFANFI
jgi:hypothetical protein